MLTLAYSTKSNEGFNSSPLSISDSTGSALTIGVAGLAYLSVPLFGNGYVTVFIISAVVLLIAVIPGLRMGDGAQAS